MEEEFVYGLWKSVNFFDRLYIGVLRYWCAYQIDNIINGSHSNTFEVAEIK